MWRVVAKYVEEVMRPGAVAILLIQRFDTERAKLSRLGSRLGTLLYFVQFVQIQQKTHIKLVSGFFYVNLYVLTFENSVFHHVIYLHFQKFDSLN